MSLTIVKLHHLKDPLNKLIALSQHSSFIQEIVIFRILYCKISIRLRRNKVTSLLKKVRKLLKDLIELDIGPNLLANCEPFLSEYLNENNPKFYKQIVQHMNDFESIAKFTKDICRYTSYLFSHCMMWLRLGHLLLYFTILMSVSARINIVCRAILVYACDLYKLFYALLIQKHYDTKDMIPCIDNYFQEFNINKFEIQNESDFGIPIARINDKKHERSLEMDIIDNDSNSSFSLCELEKNQKSTEYLSLRSKNQLKIDSKKKKKNSYLMLTKANKRKIMHKTSKFDKSYISYSLRLTINFALRKKLTFSYFILKLMKKILRKNEQKFKNKF